MVAKGRLLFRWVIALIAVAPVHGTLPAEEASRRGSVDSSPPNVASIMQQCDVGAMRLMNGRIFRDRNRDSLLRDVASEWNKIGKARSEQDACLRRPEVQLYLANSLAQGVANRVDLDIDVKTVAAVLRAQTNNVNPSLAFTAITGLAYIAEASDLQLFSEIVRSSSGPRKGAAIQALTLHCSAEAAALLRAIDDPSVQAEAAKYSALRQVRCGNGKP